MRRQLVKINKLYAFTTKSSLDRDLWKVGYSADPRQRIKSFSTGLSEPIICKTIIGVLEARGVLEAKNKQITDSLIHMQLEKNGCSREDTGGSGTEWFKCQNGLEDIKLAYKQVTKKHRLYDYKLRKEQKEAVKKCTKWFKKEGEPRFLLNAKMRFGKCITGISLAKKLKAKKTLIVTFKTNVKDNWLKYPNQHKDFKGWKGITSIKDKIYDSLEEGFDISSSKENLVLFVSMQDLDPAKKKHSVVFKTKWDLLIFDEIHYGGDAKKDKENFDIKEDLKITKERAGRLKCKYRVDMSGTPFRFKDRHSLQEEQVFTYTYLDEQENKKKEKELRIQKEDRVYAQLPDVKLFTIDTESLTTEKLEDVDWSLNEFFKTKDISTGFKYDGAVNDFLEDLISKATAKERSKECLKLSVYGDLGDGKECKFSQKRHSIWWIYGTNTANALEEKLKTHRFFKKYEIINICGDNKGIDEYKFNNKLDEISNNSDKHGSITLTQGRLLTGSTLPRIDSILVLNDCKSIETYLQAVFRVQSPHLDPEDEHEIIKKESYIFDFSIKRAYKNIKKLAEAIYVKNEETRDDKIRALITSCKICEVKISESGLQCEAPKIEDIIENYDFRSLAKKLNSRARLLNKNWLEKYNNSRKLQDIIENIRGYRNINSYKDDELINIKSARKQSRKSSASSKPPEDPETREKRKKIEDQGVRLSVILSDFMYMTEKRETIVKDIIENKIKAEEFFRNVTGISIDDFKLICDPTNGLFNKNELDDRVTHFHKEETSSVNAEQFILDVISRDKKVS